MLALKHDQAIPCAVNVAQKPFINGICLQSVKTTTTTTTSTSAAVLPTSSGVTALLGAAALDSLGVARLEAKAERRRREDRRRSSITVRKKRKKKMDKF